MQKFLNNYKTTLQTAISDTANAMQVYPSMAFDDVDTLSPGDYYLLTLNDGANIEIVKVTAVSVGPVHILSIDRDVSDSGHGSFAFAAGTDVYHAIGAESLSVLWGMVSNADYPPNYTVNQQTKSSAGTVNVPFTPIIIQQINIETAGAVILDVQPGATFGESTITIYRANLSYPWPSLKYNGNTVPVAGDPPGSGVSSAKLLCRSEPGAGYLPNPFVTFEWVTRNEPVDSGYQGPFGTSATSHGLVFSGNTLVINPLSGTYHSAAFQSSTSLNISTGGAAISVLTEVIVSCESAGGWPAVLVQGSSIIPAGDAPSGSGPIMLRVVLQPGGSRFAEWLTGTASGTATGSLSLPFSTERIIDTVAVPNYGTGYTARMDVDYIGDTSASPSSQIARFLAGSIINFKADGFSNSTDSAWSGVREMFVIIHANSTTIPTVQHDLVTITPSGSPPSVASPDPFGHPRGMLKVTIMIYGGYRRLKAEWIVFQ